jgi:RimJ/RimL family protein N-acetyltransferase
MPGPVYLSGDEVELRTIEREDLEFLQEMITDPAVWQGFGAPGPRNYEEMADRFEEQNTGTALVICHNGEPVGRVRLVDIDENWGNAELTCLVAPRAQGEGIATEASRLLVDYGFDYLPVNKITARTFESNDASQHVLEKLGFEREGTLREHVYHQGEYLDFHVYGLLERAWHP